jgi:hypothetical protein
LEGDFATGFCATVPSQAQDSSETAEKEREAGREAGTGEASSDAMLWSLRLRSANALLRLGRRRSLARWRTRISEKEPDDWRMRGRRLWSLDGTLCEVCAGGVLWASLV